MPNENIEQLKKISKLLGADKVISAADIEQILVGIMQIMNSFKRENEVLSNETKEVVNVLFNKILKEHEKLSLETKNIITNADSKLSSKVVAFVNKKTKEFDEKINEAKSLLEEIKSIEVKDGKDADEEKIIAEIVSILKQEEVKEETGESIIDKINAADNDLKIDASRIKNLPTIGVPTNTDFAISKSIYQLADVFLDNLSNGDTLIWNSTTNRWENGAGGSNAWSSITGTPTEVAYFDALGNGTSDANFTTTSTLFNLARTPGTGYAGHIEITDDALGFGIPGLGAYVQTASGYNGFLAIDTTLFGGTQDQSFYGFFNPSGGPAAEIQSRYDAGSDESEVGLVAQDSLGAGSDIEINSKTTGTNAGVTIYGPNASGSNSVFAVRDSNNTRLLYLDNDGNLQINNAWYLPNTQGTLGQFLRADGTGGSSWATIPTPSVTLTSKQIAFGSGINTVTSSSNFEYNSTSYLFTQTIPNNINNGTALGSPLAFGAPNWNSVGNNNITLNWSVSNYQSKKYIGNLTISVVTPGTAGWTFTGPYSEIIGSGSVPYLSGVPFNLSDPNGNTIAEVTLTGANVGGEQWTASSSLLNYQWGRELIDNNGHVFFSAYPVYGIYSFGDDITPNPLSGNGTKLLIDDKVAELGLFSKRYIRIEDANPGTYTAALVDMVNQTWTTYGIFRVKDVASGSVWFDVNTSTEIIKAGDVQSVGNDTLLTVNDPSRIINGQVYDGFGGSYQLTMNGIGQFTGLSANDGADYSGLIRATQVSSYIQSADSNTGVTNFWQTTAISALGQSTDGVDTMSLQLDPTVFSVTGLTNSTQIVLDDPSYLFKADNVVIRGNALHNNTNVAQGSATEQDVRSGTYTPTLTGVTNVTSTTARKCQWMRVGNVVTVSGQMDIDPAGTGLTVVGISLPVASDFGTAYECGGAGHAPALAGHGAAVYADATNNRAELSYVDSVGSNDVMTFTFTYEVI